MNKKIMISASILSSDFSRLGEEVEAVAKAGADMIHLDVMDGHFVPNITIGPAIIKSIRNRTSLPFDAHLMISNPDKYIKFFKKAGVDILTIQLETCPHLQRNLCQIKEEGMKCGVAVNPATDINFLPYVIDVIDLVLIMTVNPGFGGQKFIKTTLGKIRKARSIIEKSNRDIFLQVDGGINPKTSKEVIEAGANLLVSGSAIFKSKNYRESILKIKELN